MNIISMSIPETLYSYCDSLKQFEGEVIKTFTLPDIILRKSKIASTRQEILAIIKYKGEQFAASKS